MTITAYQARNIISSHEVIRTGLVVGLLDVVEAYAQRRRDWVPKKKCGGCDETSFFADIETKALEAIQALGPDDIAQLKIYLKAKNLWINTSAPGKASELKELK
jgi:hypothetical protein